MPKNNEPWDLGGSCWDDHTKAIHAWNGSDTKPIPKPCEQSSCPFCASWFGVEIGPPRMAAWRRRNEERGTTVTDGKVSVFERIARRAAG